MGRSSSVSADVALLRAVWRSRCPPCHFYSWCRLPSRGVGGMRRPFWRSPSGPWPDGDAGAARAKVDASVLLGKKAYSA